MNLAEVVKERDFTLILALGDSITEANHCSEGCPGYLELLDTHLRLAFGKRRYAILNAGIGGAHASSSVGYVKALLAKVKPDFTTIMYGMNDSGNGMDGLQRFSFSMDSIVSLLKESGSKVALLTQNPIDYACDIETIQKRKALPAYADLVRACAKKNDVALVDIDKAWRTEVLNVSNNEHFKMMHDGIHPNHHGHIFMFEQLKKELLQPC